MTIDPIISCAAWDGAVSVEVMHFILASGQNLDLH